MTFIPDRFFYFSIIFSGFKSQCITPFFPSNRRNCIICIAKRLIRLRESPAYRFFLRSSYKLQESSSKVIHIWPRNFQLSIMWTTLYRPPSSVSRSFYSILTSTSAWVWNLYLLRIIFNATSVLFLWSKAFTTWPKDPRPNS